MQTFIQSPSLLFRPLKTSFSSSTTTTTTTQTHPSATPRRRHRAILCAAPSPPPPSSSLTSATTPHHHLTPQDSYLQCVQCNALYMVEPDELEGAPRIVGCSACLHEWYASESDLLWGEEEALAALNQSSRDIRPDEKHARAVAAAQGVSTSERRAPVTQTSKNAPPFSDDGFVTAEQIGKQSFEDDPEGSGGDDDDDGGDVDGKTDEGAQVTRGKGRNINVFVGNLSFRATEEDLYRAFSGYGAVLKCQIPADPSGASKGYGFVEMRNRESGLRAIQCLQGTSILGRDVSLNEARPRREAVQYRRRVKERRRFGEFSIKEKKREMGPWKSGRR